MYSSFMLISTNLDLFRLIFSYNSISRYCGIHQLFQSVISFVSNCIFYFLLASVNDLACVLIQAKKRTNELTGKPNPDYADDLIVWASGLQMAAYILYKYTGISDRKKYNRQISPKCHRLYLNKIGVSKQ